MILGTHPVITTLYHDYIVMYLVLSWQLIPDTVRAVLKVRFSIFSVSQWTWLLLFPHLLHLISKTSSKKPLEAYTGIKVFKSKPVAPVGMQIHMLLLTSESGLDNWKALFYELSKTYFNSLLDQSLQNDTNSRTESNMAFTIINLDVQ